MRDRALHLNELATRVFDALVIGGGITGAGIARDAATRGLSVALVEKSDFGSGTSSRSSRLVHGGVRYLEHGHLHLVFEASTERRRLLRLAPGLVRPLPFVWPVYEGQRLPLWKLVAGLTLYDALALFQNVERHRRFTRGDVLDAEPRLRSEGLRGGVRYFDAATDDARLTLANVIDAADLGAAVANHVTFAGSSFGANGIHVAIMEDALTGDRFEVRARVLVNAGGPWSDSVASLAGQATASKVQGSKGAHIAVKRDRVGNQEAITLVHPRDGRVMFALPSGTHAIIGTTDSFTDVSPDEIRASETDVAYLLDAANAFFPDARLTRDDVIAGWAGIRPLMPSRGSAVQASREHAITRAGGIVTVTGGKLTTYRVMASEVVDAVRVALQMPRATGTTKNRPLPAPNAREEGREIEVGLPYRMSAMHHAVTHEFARTLGDLLIRRTHVAYETRDNGRAAARRVADAIAPLLQWDAAARTRELARYDAEVDRIFRIDP
ncbi:MAG TPA: glycerol-3-phosphate dehydrogenase/oxidase [Gemmatimonadaceae bacterium]|nr:glycerol-3-phosphate dehydrogenase/oxidase [Gemmatimonadaceae bacterium]